ncbi:hypothetical protein C0991_006933 [Blastosporella zonata]|nr:hypothetical protein C0991_006933 [Blastosporella zonata]
MKSPYVTASARAISQATHAYKAPKVDSTPAEKPKVCSPIVASFVEITKADNALTDLRSEFTFPEYLDFNETPVRSDNSPFGYLSFNIINRSVREHREALIRIQTDLDAISSQDNEAVRRVRKKIVNKVEQVLRELEDEVRRCLEKWRNNAVKEPAQEMPPAAKPPVNELPVPTPLEKPKPPVPKKSLQRPDTMDPDIAVTAKNFPMPPAPTPDVCRVVGLDPRFHKAYWRMSEEFTRLQIDRFQAICMGQPVGVLDTALANLDKSWKEVIHKFILVTRNGSKIELEKPLSVLNTKMTAKIQTTDKPGQENIII